MSKGVLYMVWEGEPRTEAALQRSIESLKKVHPELPYHVVRLPQGFTLLDKSKMYDLSPFEETLFLDADTVVLERLDMGFEKAGQHGVALCICECPYARRFEGLKGRGDIVEYNTGAIWFNKGWESCYGGNCDIASTKGVFGQWKRCAANLESRLLFLLDGKLTLMPLNDQASFALAVSELGFNPFVLPMNWNFRPIWHKSWAGPIKVWHDYSDPSPGFLEWNKSQAAPGAIIDFRRIA